MAGKLAWGEYSTLEFVDWRVVRQTDREIWLDLTAKWTGSNKDVHFIWSVNIEDGKVELRARKLETWRPLPGINSSARDLTTPRR